LFALIIVGIDIGLTFFLFFLFTNSSSIFYDWLPYGLAIEIVQLIGVGSIVGVIGTIRTLLFYKLSSYSLFKDLSCFKKFKSNSKNKKLDSLIIITIAFSSALIIIYLSIPLGIGVIYFIYANFLSYFCWVLLIEIIRFNIAVYLVTKKIGSMKIQPMIGF